MDHRLHDRVHPLARPRTVTPEPPRNPFRNEADAFRVLVMIAAAGAVVVAVTMLTRPLVGALVGLALLAVGLWRAWGLLQAWRAAGSEPSADAGPGEDS